MPHNRKFYPKDAVLFITSSTEDGLPFIPTIVINAILEGIIARAQFLYPQDVCHFLFMANHLHLILKITNPETVSDFIGYIKGKSADAINRLLGVRKKTIWCDGFDSPVVVTADSVIDKIVYTYANPTKARLVDSITDYPGLSSWTAFTQGKTAKKVTWITPSSITKLPCVEMTYSQQLLYLTKIKKKNKVSHVIKITPNSWMSSFSSVADKAPSAINAQIVAKVREEEQKHAKLGKPMGKAALQKQPLNLKHERKKQGIRAMFICSIVDIRVRLINWFKKQSAHAREVFQNSRYGEWSGSLPPGFFGPGRTIHANFVNFTSWVCC